MSGWHFRLLWSGQSVSVIGDGAASLAVPLLVLRATDSVVATSLAVASRTLAYVLFGFIAGALVDRWDARRTMIVCDTLRAGLFLLLPLAKDVPGGVGWLLGLAVLAASAGIFFETALAVAVQDSLHPHQLTRANARLELSNQVGLLLGPTMIGVAIATIGLEKCLWINSFTFVVSVLTIIPLRFGTRPRRAGRWSVRILRETLHDTRAGLGYVRSHRLLARLVLVQVVINFVVAAETLIVFQAERGLGAPPVWTGIVLAAAGVGGAVATVPAGWFAERFRPQALIAWSVTAIGLALLGLAAAARPWQLALANALLGALAVFATVHIRALRQRIVPREVLGRVTASARTLAVAANPVGAALFGLLAQAVGGNARWSFLAAAIMSVASAAVAYRGLLAPAAADAAADAAVPDAGDPGHVAYPAHETEGRAR